MPTVTTELLQVAYETGGPEKGLPILLLHGWPDDASGWRAVTAELEAAGFRWATPWLLDGIGHFPAREAPEAVSKLLIEHFQRR